jgi:hypothetical protein
MSRQPRRNSVRARFERPVVMLDGAGEFSDDDEMHDPVWLLRELKRYPQLLEPLQRHIASLVCEDGRDRLPGDWTLLFMAYVFSGEACLQKFRSRWASSALWSECGFGEWHPHYNTVWLRLDELEKTGAASAFRAAGDLCVRTARRHDDRVGRDSGVDATAFQAHARLRHCCPDREECKKRPRLPQLLKAASGKQVEEHRHADAAKAPREDDALDNSLRGLPDDDPRRAALPVGPRYYLQHGHVYRCLDSTAGARSYDGEFWVGGLLQAAVDVFTGGVLALQAVAADVAEHLAYPELLERAKAATGAYPNRVTGDRGYSVRKTFLYNSELGIASAFAWRKWNEKARRDMDRDEVDRHGVPRCRDCGGPGDVSGAGLGFHRTRRGEPVIRFRCQLGLAAGCGRVQQISCSVEPRLLVPLSRLTEQYNAMRHVGLNLERVWGHWRQRYRVAGKAPDTRTRRRESITCQELRAEAARFIDWFRILLRNGWLGSHRRRNNGEEKQVSGKRRLGNILRARDRHGLNLPYGRAAFEGGFAPDPDPPPEPPAGKRK